MIDNDVSIGNGTKIWHFSHIRENTKIGKNVTIGQNVYIDKDVVVGDNCKIQNNVSLYKGVILGNNVFIGPGVTFTNDLYPSVEGWDDSKILSTTVEDGASIGANTTLICGVKIGENSLIGAGSLVTKDVPKNSLSYGNPSEVIKKNFKNK